MKKKITNIIFIVTVIILVVTGILLLFGNKNSEGVEAEQHNVPSPNQLMYGIKRMCEVENDVTKMRDNLLSDPRYAEYDLKEQYRMIYQIRDDESAKATVEFLEIKDELPVINYENNYMLLSIGSAISDVKKSAQSRYSGEKADLLDVVYDIENYTEGTIHVYMMNKINVLSGKGLDRYYWENVSEYCNFVESSKVEKKEAASGTYFKAYSREDEYYEYVLLNNKGEITARKLIQGEIPDIKEISTTLVRISSEQNTTYFNPETNEVSEEYTFNTKHLIYNIITYMRIHNGEIQLILRDAYDQTFYAKIVRLPFAQNVKDIDTLVTNIQVVDDTHIKVEYINTDNKTVTELVNVYNLER